MSVYDTGYGRLYECDSCGASSDKPLGSRCDCDGCFGRIVADTERLDDFATFPDDLM